MLVQLLHNYSDTHSISNVCITLFCFVSWLYVVVYVGAVISQHDKPNVHFCPAHFVVKAFMCNFSGRLLETIQNWSVAGEYSRLIATHLTLNSPASNHTNI